MTSEVGHGTDVRIRLPLSSEELTSTKVAPAAVVPRAPEPTSRTRVLVAEDEDMIRELLEQLLTDASFEVVTAIDGADALAKWSQLEGRFDLVLLDVVMPRLDGWKTYERLRELDPRIPVLFSSGYSASTFPDQLTAHDAPQILSKPYSANELLRAIETALTAAAKSSSD